MYLFVGVFNSFNMLWSEGSVYEIGACKFSLNSCQISAYMPHLFWILVKSYIGCHSWMVIRLKFWHWCTNLYTPLQTKVVQICTLCIRCTNLYKPIRGGVYKFVHPNNNASDLVQIVLHFARLCLNFLKFSNIKWQTFLPPHKHFAILPWKLVPPSV